VETIGSKRSYALTWCMPNNDDDDEKPRRRSRPRPRPDLFEVKAKATILFSSTPSSVENCKTHRISGGGGWHFLFTCSITFDVGIMYPLATIVTIHFIRDS